MKYTLCKTKTNNFFIESKEDSKNMTMYHRTDAEEDLSHIIHIFKDCNDYNNITGLGFQNVGNLFTTNRKYEKEYLEIFSFDTTKELEDYIKLNFKDLK